MSDERLRELERRWRETGSVEDEAAWLRERVRVGDLSQERLELAAYCRHAAAERAYAGPRLDSPNGLLQWVHGIEGRLGASGSALLSLGPARIAFDHWKRTRPDDGRGRAAMHALEDWLECPCIDHAQSADAERRRMAIYTWETPEEAWVARAIHRAVSLCKPGVSGSLCVLSGRDVETSEQLVARVSELGAVAWVDSRPECNVMLGGAGTARERVAIEILRLKGGLTSPALDRLVGELRVVRSATEVACMVARVSQEVLDVTRSTVSNWVLAPYSSSQSSGS